MINILYILLSGAVFGIDQAGKQKSRKQYHIVNSGPFENSKDSAGSVPAAAAAEKPLTGKNAEKSLRTAGPIVFRNLHNHGAMLNLGAVHHSALIRIISVLLTVFLTIVYIVTLGHAGKNLLKAGLSLLLGGAFSNTYDRLKDGYVTDYLSFRFVPKAFQNVVFNIGDFAIIIGALMTALGA